jgi:hypothetical protein
MNILLELYGKKQKINKIEKYNNFYIVRGREINI